ncbi:rhombosortase [Pleionea sp. CnH1-48]|uniref:rhombosortase n=1 Tax=Pleionea sp. CnH1-48 TaxID=2954494 RepID=UPI0020982FE2|nr:rhombosortase [Pleionea sp. CnH1-48]MCO7223815.1 rhombosortase [Pleionea sp. CnH1-48]
MSSNFTLNIHTQILRYHIPLLFTLCIFLTAYFHSELIHQFNFNRSKIIEGEWWRLFSANLLHTNWNHALLNIAGLWIIWYIYWDIGNRLTQWAFILIPVLINTLPLFLFVPHIEWYVGLSGALHGTIVAFGIADFRNSKFLSLGLLVGVTIKLSYEVMMGSSEWIENFIGDGVVVEAHVAGALSGIIAGIGYLILIPKLQTASSN